MKEKRIKIDQEEVDSFILINTRIQTATQALDFRALPNDVNFEHAAAYFAAALGARAEADFLVKDWWRTTLAKYGLTGKHVHIDTDNGELIVHE